MGTPCAACCNTAVICSTEKRFFTARLLARSGPIVPQSHPGHGPKNPVPSLRQYYEEYYGAVRTFLAKHEEIRARLDRHEPRQRGGAQSKWSCRDRHVARRLVFPVVVAAHRILVVVEPAEARIVPPCLLHEFELASNAGRKIVNAAC